MRKEHLEYFKGRVVTIFTVPTNRNFKEENPEAFLSTHFHYFMGQILDIDDEGILFQQVARSPEQPVLMSYYYKEHIIGVVEEEIVKDEKTIEVLKEAHEQRIDQMNKSFEEREIKAEDFPEMKNPYVDAEALQKRAQEMAERFK